MNRKIILTYLLSVFTLNTYAATDPVSWTLSPASGFPPVNVDGQSVITYTLTSHLHAAATMLTSYNIVGAGITKIDNCNGKSLNPGASCTIQVTYAPTVPGTTTFQLTYGYNRNRIPLPKLTISSDTASARLTGIFTEPQPFPSIIYTDEAPYITAVFINNGGVKLTNCKVSTATGFALTPSNAATIVTTTEPSTCGSSGSTVTIDPNHSCSVYGQLTSLVVSPTVTLDSTVTCDQASASADKNFAIQTGSGACTTVLVQPNLLLPSNTFEYADNVVQFKIVNECAAGSPSLTLGPVTFTEPVGAATVTTNNTYDLCSNQTLAAGESCLVSASVIPTATGALTVQANVTPGGGTQTSGSTSSNVASNQTSTHYIKFINQCNFDVWYGIANGTGAAGSTPDPNLNTYPSGAPAASYLLPAQVLGKAPSTILLSTASYQGGSIWPRTGCTFNSSNQFVCTTGACATIPGSATCNSTGALVQPQSPYTKLEADMTSTAGTDGVYDVSAVNGMNVPAEFKAFGPPTGNTPSTVFNCGAGGAIIQPATANTLGNCSWRYNPSSSLPGSNVNNYFYWVAEGSDDGCTTSALPNLCGEAWGSGPDALGNYGTPINRRLGAFLGFNMLDAYAAYTVTGTNNGTWGSVNVFTDFGLDIQIPGQSAGNNYGTIPHEVIFPGNTYLSYYALISCPVVSSTGALNSCYQTSTDNTNFPDCCGCFNWTNTASAYDCGAYSGGAYTAGMNTYWTGTAGGTSIPAPVGNYTPQEAVTWIKDACPTAYAYTYDDPSSQFQCNYDGSTALNTSYEVVFCPGGVNAKPDGAAEGRSATP